MCDSVDSEEAQENCTNGSFSLQQPWFEACQLRHSFNCNQCDHTSATLMIQKKHKKTVHIAAFLSSSSDLRRVSQLWSRWVTGGGHQDGITGHCIVTPDPPHNSPPPPTNWCRRYQKLKFGCNGSWLVPNAFSLGPNPSFCNHRVCVRRLGLFLSTFKPF